MCWCNPELRTPCCGGMNCVPPKDSNISNNTLLKDSQLTLWQNYCDKKMECEQWKELFEKTLAMLEYAHTTSEVYYDHNKVSEFIAEMNKYLKEK